MWWSLETIPTARVRHSESVAGTRHVHVSANVLANRPIEYTIDSTEPAER